MSEVAAQEAETGAPIAKDAIDPDLVKLKRKRPKVGIVTAAGLVFLCVFFIVRLWPDRAFGGSGAPTKTTAAEVLAGKSNLNDHVSVSAEPLVSHAIRTTISKGSVGLRLVPARGTNEKVWLVVNGDGWEVPNTAAYVGRLRSLDDLPFASAVRDYAIAHPRPLFATPEAIRAATATNQVATVSGETIALADGDQVAFDVVDPNATVIVASLGTRLPDEASWKAALERAGLPPTKSTPLPDTREVRFEIALPSINAAAQKKLEAAELYAVRVEPVTRHTTMTWAELKKSQVPPGAELVGLYVQRAIPDGAYAVIVGEKPADYWYVLPITIGLAILALIFSWALVRAVKRDLMTPQSTIPS